MQLKAAEELKKKRNLSLNIREKVKAKEKTEEFDRVRINS